MAKDKEDKKFTVVSDGHGLLRTVFVTIAFVAVIMLVTCYIAVRTEVVRGRIEEWLEEETGLELIVASTRLGWACNIVVEGLQSEPMTNSVALAEVTADEVRIGVAWNLDRRITVRSGRLVLQKTAEEEWEPRFLARLGNLRNVEQLGVATQKMRKKTRLTVVGASIYWVDAKGERLARVEDLDFSIVPVTLKTGRKLHHCNLSAYLVAWERGSVTHNMSREWFFTAQNQFIEVASQTGESTPKLKDEL